MPAADKTRRDDTLFRAIVDHVPEAILVVTPEGEVTFLNRMAEDLLGYPAAEVVGRDIGMLVPARPGRRADPVKWLARWAAEPQPEQARWLDFQARRRDGLELPVDVRVSEGRVDGARRFFVTFRDNTARRQEQRAFNQNSLRAARILLVAEDAIVSCDEAQNITFFNLAAERLFGWRADEVLDRPLAMLLPAAARGRHPDLVAAFGAGAAASRMMRERARVLAQRRSGEVFPVEAAITKVRVGEAITYTAHLRDVSERKAAEARLAETTRRLRAVFDHALDAIALLAPDGTVLEINAAARALTQGGEGLVGRPLWQLPWLGTPGGAPDAAARERLRAAIAAAAAGMPQRHGFALSDGPVTREVDLTLTPITDETGAVIYILREGRVAD